MSLKFDAACEQSFTDLTKTNSNWILWEVENKEVKVTGSGSGGLAELVSQFQEDKVYFGCLKVLAVDDRENTKSIRTKIVSFSFIGNKVPVLKKANAGPQRNEVFAKFKGTAGSIDVNDAKDFTSVAIKDLLLRSGGAHKPTRYEFGDGTIESIDAFHGKA